MVSVCERDFWVLYLSDPHGKEKAAPSACAHCQTPEKVLMMQRDSPVSPWHFGILSFYGATVVKVVVSHYFRVIGSFWINF